MAHNTTVSEAKHGRNDSKVILKSLTIHNKEDVIDSLFTTCEINDQLQYEIRNDLVRFLDEFIRISTRLKGSQIDQFHEACKRRYSAITDLSVQIMQRQDSEVVQITTKDGRTVSKTNWSKGRNVVVDNYKLFSLEFDPRVYNSLFKAIYNGLDCLSNQYEYDYLDEDEYNSQIKYLMLITSSIAKIYEDLRGNKAYNLLSEQESLSRITKSFSLDYNDEWYDVFNNVKADILEGYQGGTPKRYVRNIINGMRKGKLDKDYTDLDYSYSMRSSNTKYKGKTVPALYASLVEKSSHGESSIPGYIPRVNTKEVAESLFKMEQARTITIESSSLSRRMIHIFDNETQDRMNYFHRRLSNILRNTRNDCTFDQSKGIRFAQSSTQSPGNNNIYSLDISKATDTLSTEFQKEVLSIFFKKDLVDEWFRIINQEREMAFCNGKSRCYYQTVGQPQGIKSSFPAFALVHHIIFLMIMLKNGYEDMDSFEFYHVLGDDSIFRVFDPNLVMRNSYIQACEWINWYVNPNKGYSYIYGVSVSAIAEFAKVRFRDGDQFTPVPIKLLLRSVVDENLRYILYWWSSKYIKPITLHEFMNHLGIPNDKRGKLSLAWTILGREQISICKDFILPSDTLPEEYINWTIMTYYVKKLKDTLLSQYLPDFARENQKLGQKWVDPFLNSEWENLMMSYSDNTNGKYFQMLIDNESVIRKLDDVFGQLGCKVFSSGILAMPFEDISLIFSATDIIDLVVSDQYDYDPTREDIKVLKEAIQLLEKYNPRSDTKSALANWDLMLSLGESSYDNVVNRQLVSVA